MQQHTEQEQQPQQWTRTAVGERGRAGVAPPGGVALSTETGTTRIAENVVAKIAGLAAREIPGVYAMGRGPSRVGQLRSIVAGAVGDTLTQGVSVQVGQNEAAIDLNLVTWYGQSIVDITDAVRRNVIGRVEGATGLKVVEVNIAVDDIHVETEEGVGAQQERVR